MNLNTPLPRREFTIQAQDYRIDLGKITKVMGIINVTPDSFSHDGCLSGKNYTSKAVALGKKFIREGADILDVGGESSRPGSCKISIEEEIKRVVPAIKKLSKITKVPISIDTYKSSVAKQALDAGANIVNNIKGVTCEKNLLAMVKRYNAAIILMHIRGTPRTMQKKISYHDLMKEIIASLQKSIEKCLEIGIKSDKIIIDPGIGFGKTVENNLEILNRLADLSKLNHPILIGTSRKSFIGKTLEKNIDQRLMGTAATVCAGILRGAHIVRVHDVKKIKDTVKMMDAIINQNITHVSKLR